MNDKANAAAPANTTVSELESELRDGVPSAVTVPLCSGLTGECEPCIWPECDCEPDCFAPQAHATTPETVGEKLKRVYPEHYVTIITIMNKQNGSKHTVDTLSSEAVGHELQYVFL